MERGCADDESEYTYRRKWCLRNQMEGHVVGAQRSRPAARGGSTGAPGRRRQRCVNWPPAPLAARARISSRAARCTDRFAKPSVMQGVPLPTRGCSRTAGRKSGTRRSGAGARAAATRPRTPVKCSQCRVSVASRTLELCCASPTPTAGLF